MRNILIFLKPKIKIRICLIFVALLISKLELKILKTYIIFQEIHTKIAVFFLVIEDQPIKKIGKQEEC